MEQASVRATTGVSWGYWTIVAAFGLFLGGAALWGANRQVLGSFHDDGIYAVVGKSLAEGNGYRIISLPGTPPQTKYPFLYSYLLSWIWAFDENFPDNIIFLKALNVAILIALFFGGVIYYRNNFANARVAALLFSLLLCTNPVIFTLTDYVLSDLLMVFFALVALILGSSDSKSVGSRSNWPGLALAVGLACLTRSAAIPLVIGGVIRSVSQRPFRESVYFVGAVLLVVAPWLLWVAFTPRPESGSLFDYYSGYDFAGAGEGWSLDRQLSVVAGNARYLLDSIDLIYLLPLLPGVTPVVVLLTAIGVFHSIRKDELFMWSFFLSTLALLLIWPFHPNRYSTPLIPLLLLFLFRGIQWVRMWLSRLPFPQPMRNLLSGVVALPIALLLVLNGIWLSSYLLIRDDQTTRGFYGSRVKYSWSGFEESFTWVRQNASPESVLGTAYDPMYFLYTGRKAIRPALHRSASYFYPYGTPNPDVGTAAEIHPQMMKLGVRYLIIDPLDGYAEGQATLRLLDDIVNSYGQRAKLVFTSSDGKHRIYEVKPK
jgi:4-amino-4-deoxy-L-arabinose transferase-like glycosyltransferase